MNPAPFASPIQRIALYMTTTLRLSKDTSKNLESYAARHRLKSKDAAIRHLLGLEGDEDEAPSARRDASDGSDDERVDIQKEPKKKFFSYEDLAREDSAMKYFTGLKREARLWLWERLRNLV